MERALLEECLQLAQQAPTAGFAQNWHFVVLRPKVRSAYASHFRPGKTVEHDAWKSRSRRRAGMIGLALVPIFLFVAAATALLTDPLGIIGLLVLVPVFLFVLALALVAFPAIRAARALRTGPGRGRLRVTACEVRTGVRPLETMVHWDRW